MDEKWKTQLNSIMSRLDYQFKTYRSAINAGSYESAIARMWEWLSSTNDEIYLARSIGAKKNRKYKIKRKAVKV